ncbi:MAG: TetR/AcrR family transcriptional regulator [Janthinobacterium lividum]
MSIPLPQAGADRPIASRRRPGRPQRQLAALLPGSILAEARALFLDRGYAATSLEAIAAQAGVTKRTLYVKVGDKEAIFAAVVGAMLQDWRHVVDGDPPGHSLQQRFEAIGRQLLAVSLEPDMVQLHRVMLAEAYRFPALVNLLVAQIEQGPIPQLARLLMRARGAEGEPAEADQVAARLFYDMVVAAPLRMALTGRPPSLDITPEGWVRRAVAVFLLGWRDVSGIVS